jgi:transcriptional regulator with XRE-family HTH domain
MKLIQKVGLKIRYYRLEKGLTQEELAFKTNLHQAQITRLENGKQRFNSDQLEKISQVLEIPITCLFEDELTELKDTEIIDIANNLKLNLSKKKQIQEIIELIQNSEDSFKADEIINAIKLIRSIKKEKS